MVWGIKSVDSQMATIPKSIPLWKYQLVGWLVWGVVLWLYVDKVVPEAFTGWADWAALFVIHIGTANVLAFWVGPRVISALKLRQYARATLYGGLFLLGILVGSILLSLVAGAMAVRPLDAGPEVVNRWQVLVVLYAGVLPGLGYYGALWSRHLLQVDRVRFTELQQRVQEIVDGEARERLNAQLIPHLLNNLMDTLRYVVKWRPARTGYVLDCITECCKAYSRHDGHSLIALADELDLLDLYIHILGIRLGFRPNIRVNVVGHIAGCGCIPMMLIFLVENMKKYALISDAAHPASISLRIVEGVLHVKATNRKNHRIDDDSTGIGLRNLEERLKLYWGNEAQFSITGADAASDVFCVRIACHTELFA